LDPVRTLRMTESRLVKFAIRMGKQLNWSHAGPPPRGATLNDRSRREGIWKGDFS
jgi:hypothetical protein